jgi:putative cofactor-binding repeat protein
VLRGFTIRNGTTTFASGYEGGGIYIAFSSPQILDNTIINNTGCQGIGVGAYFGSPLIQGNTISNNVQTNCSTGAGGGGVSVGGNGATRIIGNIISNNLLQVAGNGGGIFLNAAGAVVVQGNIITNNVAQGIIPGAQGGGISLINGESATITQNLIVGNSAPQGGGVYFVGPYGFRGPFLVNNTIANNEGSFSSGVYATGYDSQSRLINNLIVAKPGEPAVVCDGLYDPTPPIVSFNDAYSSGGTAYSGTCAGAAGTNGNISADPVFLDPAANFHLQPTSPAIDAGANSAPGLPSTDLDGNPRIQNGVVDMGAYEFSPATMSLSFSSIAFGDQQLGTSTAPQTITLMNTGSTPLFLAFSINGDFSQTNNCGTAVAAGANCGINVTFTPTAPGLRTGALIIADNALGSPQSVSLSGTGLGPSMSLSSTILTFAGQFIGTTSTTQPVTLSNTGNAPLNFTSGTISGDFTQTNNCARSVSPGGSCTINVGFAPKAEGTRTGAITISDNALGSPQTVSLRGTGVGRPALSAKITVQSKVGTTLTLGIQITNVGTGAAVNVLITQVTLTTLSGSGTVTLNSPSLPYAVGTLAVGASVPITLSFNVPTTVTKFSMAGSGTMQDIIGDTIPFATPVAIFM